MPAGQLAGWFAVGTSLMRTVITSLVLAGLLTGVGACVRYTEPLRSQERMTPAGRNFDNLWRASQYVLKKYHFTLDIQDRRAGLISTEPMVGKHFFEFWRHDSTTRGDTHESTVQTIYRTAFVTISRGGSESEAYRPKVVVTVGRSNLGETSIVAVSDAYRLPFAERVGREHEKPEDPGALEAALKKAAETGQYLQPVLPEWLTPLGRDEKLEQKILGEIVEAATKRIYMRKLELPWPKPLW